MPRIGGVNGSGRLVYRSSEFSSMCNGGVSDEENQGRGKPGG